MTGNQEPFSMSDDLSATMLDYLVETYRMSKLTDDPDDYVSTSALANLLNVSAPAVNRMITKLKDTGMLTHEPYQGVKLTTDGERHTLIKLRRQRIAESFLVNVMGFGWHEIYEEADRMSNALNETLTERMLEMAGNPTHCPHGEPIPTKEGIILEIDDRPLAKADVGGEYIITRVRTREADRLEYIAALGLVPGTRLQLIHSAPFDGPLQLKLGEEYRIVGHNLASVIRVQVVDDGVAD
jgi:DtxR family Mn-dependent transcriptional regulator